MQGAQRWADRRRSIEFDGVPARSGMAWYGVSRSGHARVLAPSFSIWLQVRGGATISSREGDFRLAAGKWIAFDRGSFPELRADRNGLTLGIGLPPTGHALLAGGGRIPASERPGILRLWRQAMQGTPADVHSPAVKPLLLQLARLQQELSARADLCPGRSRHRKLQVFSRMQHARFCLEGQVDAGLRIADLAKRINFSPWYFSKVFHAVYGIGPRQFAARARMEHASRLLATTSLPVTEVSAACGFENPCSFARAFRARFGMSASEHRLRGAR